MVKRLALLLAALTLFAASAWADSFPGPASQDGARIYFYRPQGSNQYLAWATITLNGEKIGALAPGSYLFRDVAPGTYTVGVNGDIPYVYDKIVVTVPPGGTPFVEAYNVPGYGFTYTLGPPPSVNFPNVYGLRLIAPPQAAQEMSGLAPNGGN